MNSGRDLKTCLSLKRPNCCWRATTVFGSLLHLQLLRWCDFVHSRASIIICGMNKWRRMGKNPRFGSPQDGLVILYPDSFWVLKKEPRTWLQRISQGTDHLLPSTHLSRSKIIVSLLPPAGLFIHLHLDIEGWANFQWLNCISNSIAMELCNTEVFYDGLYLHPTTTELNSTKARQVGTHCLA